MPPKYIYFTDDIYMKLQKEDNASGLIQGLLEKHYGSINRKKKKFQDLKKQESRIKKALERKNINEFIRDYTEQYKLRHNGLSPDQEFLKKILKVKFSR